MTGIYRSSEQVGESRGVLKSKGTPQINLQLLAIHCWLWAFSNQLDLPTVDDNSASGLHQKWWCGYHPWHLTIVGYPPILRRSTAASDGSAIHRVEAEKIRMSCDKSPQSKLCQQMAIHLKMSTTVSNNFAIVRIHCQQQLVVIFVKHVFSPSGSNSWRQMYRTLGANLFCQRMTIRFGWFGVPAGQSSVTRHQLT